MALSPIASINLQEKIIGISSLRGLWRMMDGFHLVYAAATTSLMIAALSKASTLMLLRYFVDNVLGNQADYYRLPWIALGFLLFATFEGLFSYLSGRLSSFTAEGITRRLRNYLFDHIQRLTFAYHAKIQTGDLIQRSTSDVDAIRRFYSEQAIGIGRIFLLFIINFIAIYQLNATLALVSIIVVPVIFITSIFFFRRVTKAYEANQEQEATLSTVLQENLTGVRVVKAFARQDYEKLKYDKENWEKFIRGRKLTLMHSLFWPVSDIICGFQMLGGFYVGATLAMNGTITVGTYLAYAGLVVWLIWPMRNLGRLIVQTSTGMVSFGRVKEIIKQIREPLEEGEFIPKEKINGRLEFDRVCFNYEDDESIVLKDITFICEPGQIIGLLGSTGSGKTSLVNLLPRFYEYSEGHIYLDGIELTNYPRNFLRSQIGMVEQEPFLFSRSIRENIIYGVQGNISQSEIEIAARMAAIDDVIKSFPKGYDTLIGEKGVTLSGGQKQRLTIARTLLKNPRILILDDSTSSVDFETEAEIRNSLSILMKNRTTFIIAHRIQSIVDADLILVLNNGQIVQSGTHDALVSEKGIYRQIFDIQTRIEAELDKEVKALNHSY